MKLTAKVVLIGKDATTFVDANGNKRTSYLANIAQEQGRIIDTLRVPEESFAILEAGHEYLVELVSSTGKNGTYIRVINISPVK